MRQIVQVLTGPQEAALLAEIEKSGANPELTELVKKVFGQEKK
jgi:hypothetical protein